DGVLSEEELNKAIAKYLATKDQKAVDADDEDVPQEEEKKAAVPGKAPVPAKAIAPNSAPMPAKDAPAEAPKTKVPTEDDDDAPQKVAPKETPKEAPIAKGAPAPKRQPVTIGSLSKKPEIVPEEEEDDDEDMSVEDRVNAVRDRDEERKAQIVPDNEDDVNEVIGSQGMDIKELMDIIDTLLAERDINKQKADGADQPKKIDPEDYSEDSEDDEEEYSDEDYDEDEDDEPKDDTDDSDDDEDYEDEDYTEEEDSEDEPEDDEYEEDDDEDFSDEDNEEDKFEEDECNAEWCDPEDYPSKKRTDVAKKSRADSVDRQTRQLTETMKRIIHTAYPNMRLDGKGFAYLNAACDMACEEIAKSNKKGVDYQYKQMFNADSKKVYAKPETAMSARQRMIKKIVK
ncbi:MAG: hypothetical protein LUE27_11655, partial [Clostridia bacterium]|nr:hypothetical protein [Clostridia bacterium]